MILKTTISMLMMLLVALGLWFTVIDGESTDPITGTRSTRNTRLQATKEKIERLKAERQAEFDSIDQHSRLAQKAEARKRKEERAKARKAAEALAAENGTQEAADAASAKKGKAGNRAENAKAGKRAAEDEEDLKERPPKKLVKDRSSSLDSSDRVVLTLRGRVTRASFNRLSGYVYDSAAREAEFKVLLFVDGKEAMEIPAETREEHKTLGVIWRFDQRNPEALADRKGHTLRFYAVREGKVGRSELASSPRNLAENNYPRGRLEACSASEGVNGYAYDWDNTKLATEVLLYLDGQLVKTIKAGEKNTIYRKKRLTPTNNNAFKTDFFVPDDGASHLVQAFAKDAVSEELVELDGSPRSVMGSRDAVNRPPEGRLSVVNRSVIAGWAWDPDTPDLTIDVELWIDGKKFNTITASSPRQTLVSAKITKDPNHGFVVQPPIELLDGEAHTVRVFAIDPQTQVRVEVEGSRKLYRASENEAPMGGFWRADEKMLRGWAVDPDLGAAACEISIYIDGKLWKTQKAERSENFILQDGYAPNKEHGFLIKPPEEVKDGHQHEVKIYAHNAPDGPPKLLGTRTIGVKSIFPGFWTSDKELDSRAPQGLYITSVSPWYDAYHQGVLKGDVMLTLAGIKYTKTAKFREELTKLYKKNQKVKVTFWRDGEEIEKEIKLGEIIGR